MRRRPGKCLIEFYTICNYIESESAHKRETNRTVSDGGHERGCYGSAVVLEMKITGIAVSEIAEDFIDRVDKEGYDISQDRRAEEVVVVVDNISFEAVEKLADNGSYKRSNKYILDGRALHGAFDAEFPSDGGYTCGIEQRLIEVESACAGRHEVYRSGIGMEDVVEHGIIAIDFRATLDYVLPPAFVEGDGLYGGFVPVRSTFGQAFKHEQCADKSAGIYGGVKPQAVPVRRTAAQRIGQLVDGYRFDFCGRECDGGQHGSVQLYVLHRDIFHIDGSGDGYVRQGCDLSGGAAVAYNRQRQGCNKSKGG